MKRKTYGLVYFARNKITNKFYVGWTSKSFEQRKKEHLTATDDSEFHLDLKFNSSKFDWQILEHDVKRIRENYWITIFDSKEKGYNKVCGDLIENSIESSNKCFNNQLLSKAKDNGLLDQITYDLSLNPFHIKELLNKLNFESYNIELNESWSTIINFFSKYFKEDIINEHRFIIKRNNLDDPDEPLKTILSEIIKNIILKKKPSIILTNFSLSPSNLLQIINSKYFLIMFGNFIQNGLICISEDLEEYGFERDFYRDAFTENEGWYQIKSAIKILEDGWFNLELINEFLQKVLSYEFDPRKLSSHMVDPKRAYQMINRNFINFEELDR